MESRKTTDLELYQTEDRELWYAQAPDKTWQLPMWVDWKHDRKNDAHYALINPAVSLYTNQTIMIQALFGPHTVIADDTRWLLPRRMAETLLIKAPGITPTVYYKWPNAACPPIPPAWNMARFTFKDPPERPWACQTFVKHVAKTHRIPASVVRAVLTAVGDEAPTWMLRHRKPIELGFCRLIAAPFRSNWKEIVSFKCRGFRLPSILSLNYTRMMQLLEGIGMPGIMCSPDNIGMSTTNENYHIDYVIEAIPTVKFEKAVHALETERIACGDTTYVSLFEETVEILYRYLLQALESYCKKAAQPFAQLCASSISGVSRLLPIVRRKATVGGVRATDLPVNIIPPTTSFSTRGIKSDPALIQAQIKALQAVPDLHPEIKNLRRRYGERLLRRYEIWEKSNGLLMPHAGQSVDTGKPMLSSGENSGDGLDTK